MNNKIYTIRINQSKRQVWDIMLGEKTYMEWIKGFSENSGVVGEWKQGTEIDFIDKDHGGTRAILEVVDAPNRLLARHIAVLDKDGNPQTVGMENWIGTTEEYLLHENAGVTDLEIVMTYHSDYEKMLDEGWKKSLELLKRLCENADE